MKPLLLDTFCKAGGAGMGYHQAGFEVVGVDIEPQKNYPFEFHRGDAIEFIMKYGHEFDAIHASPPCQAYSVTKSMHDNTHPDLVKPTRKALVKIGKHYVIENVPGSPLINPLILCGSMFGLKVKRHRLFECNPDIYFVPMSCGCRNKNTSSHRGISSFDNGADFITVAGHNFCVEDAKKAMGIDWMTGKELSQAIPPAYTKFIGEVLIKKLNR